MGMLIGLNFTFSLQDFMLFLLTLAGILVLVFLAKLFMDLSKTVNSINKAIEENRPNIDRTISDIPEITAGVNNVLYEVDELLEEARPKVVSVLKDVNTVTNSASQVTTNISDTVEVVGVAVTDTVSNLVDTFGSSTNKLSLIKGLVKMVLKK